jgi:molybdopterin-guanine dinucleotide biosynthesis protein A
MHATHTYVFVMACDMPFWEPELIQKIIKDCDGYDATVLKVNGYYEPLFAVYAKSCLPSITENLEEGRLKVTGFFDSIRLNTIDLTGCMEEDLLRRVTFNLNTPEDLQVLKKMGLEAF